MGHRPGPGPPRRPLRVADHHRVGAVRPGSRLTTGVPGAACGDGYDELPGGSVPPRAAKVRVAAATCRFPAPRSRTSTRTTALLRPRRRTWAVARTGPTRAPARKLICISLVAVRAYAPSPRTRAVPATMSTSVARSPPCSAPELLTTSGVPSISMAQSAPATSTGLISKVSRAWPGARLYPGPFPGSAGDVGLPASGPASPVSISTPSCSVVAPGPPAGAHSRRDRPGPRHRPRPGGPAPRSVGGPAQPLFAEAAFEDLAARLPGELVDELDPADFRRGPAFPANITRIGLSRRYRRKACRGTGRYSTLGRPHLRGFNPGGSLVGPLREVHMKRKEEVMMDVGQWLHARFGRIRSGRVVLLNVLALVAVVVAPQSVASASSPAPKPGTPAYMARDVQNMEAAFGRPLSQLENPDYLPEFSQEALSLYTNQLETQLQNPTRPSLTGGSILPGDAAGNPDREHWAGTRGLEQPVVFTAGDGASLRGDVDRKSTRL